MPKRQISRPGVPPGAYITFLEQNGGLDRIAGAVEDLAHWAARDPRALGELIVAARRFSENTRYMGLAAKAWGDAVRCSAPKSPERFESLEALQGLVRSVLTGPEAAAAFITVFQYADPACPLRPKALDGFFDSLGAVPAIPQRLALLQQALLYVSLESAEGGRLWGRFVEDVQSIPGRGARIHALQETAERPATDQFRKSVDRFLVGIGANSVSPHRVRTSPTVRVLTSSASA
jgi:hypothetical protein